MGFMACSRRLDQTGMYLKNEYSVFKGHPDFRPYKVSLTRILLFRVGLVGALWLSLQDHLWFVLTFPVHCAAGLRQKKKYPVGFPTRHQKWFYSVFCKLVPVYLLVTIFESRPMHQSPCAVMQSIFIGFPHLKTDFSFLFSCNLTINRKSEIINRFSFLFSDRYWVKSIESLLTCLCLFKYLY